MRQYNALQAIFLSFYSQRLYRDVARNWGGMAFIYLFVVLALSWILATWQMHLYLNREVRPHFNRIVEQTPPLTFTKGELSTPEKRPYTITNRDDRTLYVIDTSGRYTNPIQANADILLTQNALITQSEDKSLETHPYPKAFNFTFSPSPIGNTLGSFLGFLSVPYFLLMLLGSFLYRCIQALIYGVFGILFARITNVPLRYGQTVPIAIVAVTPAIVISTLFDFLPVHFPLQHLFYFCVALFYVYYGVTANKV